MIVPGVGEPVVSPVDWVGRSGFRPLCDRCVLVFWDRLLGAVRDSLERVLVVEERPRVPATLGGVVGELGGARACAYRVWSGAPAAAMALEFLIAAGIRRFLVLGGCGAIHPSVGVFDVVAPSWGIREEGTSYHYLSPDLVPRPSRKALELLVTELGDAARELGVRLHVGGVWSTDAVFRETWDKVQRYSSRGALCVDMESTALMAVAMYRGVELGLAHIVTDELYTGTWRPYSDRERMARVEKRVVLSVLRALARM